MYCPACGAPSVQGVRFCAKCGAQITAPTQYAPYPVSQIPGYSQTPRVQRNLQALAALWCIFGVYRLAMGVIGLIFFRVATANHGGWGPLQWWGDSPFASHWMAGFYPIVMTVAMVMAGLAFAVAYSLMTRQPWGRMLAIVIAIISLFKIPFGTVLGIYTLWVLAPAESGAEYEAISAGD